MADPVALIVAGPTCSGKSALAMALAQRVRGTVVNADAMQCYRELLVLTARPTPEDEATVPHALYGVRPAAEPGNAAWWRGAALAAMARANADGRVPILCGGTGLYLQALRDGIADLPEVSRQVREEARGLLAAEGPQALHARLAAVDPATAERLKPGDSQRIARAWEVWRQTGRGLSDWQGEAGTPAPWRFASVLLDPPREALRAAIAARTEAMFACGAVDEVRALMEQGLDPALPAMRAHGVPEIAAFLRGEIDRDEAMRRTALVTGQYTKRQATWFRHHPLADPPHMYTIHARMGDFAQFSERVMAALVNFVEASG